MLLHHGSSNPPVIGMQDSRWTGLHMKASSTDPFDLLRNLGQFAKRGKLFCRPL
jgi:hypothetical protein